MRSSPTHPLIDALRLTLRGGTGGAGVASFDADRRPMGGDGGDGGSIFCIEDASLRDLKCLSTHQNGKVIQAPNGSNGSSNNRSGRSGDDLLLHVPLGTTFSSIKRVIEVNNTPSLLVRGGLKGKGNLSLHHGNADHTTGHPGEEEVYSIDLRHIADVGLVGPPNAGKSSLLRSLTRSQCQVASYPFTTINPNLGCIPKDNIIIADIPGLIEGAAQNRGLGHRFLKHLERSKIVSLVIDVSTLNTMKDIKMIYKELGEYKAGYLLPKIQMILLNKADLISYEELVKVITDIKECPSLFNLKILPISALHNAATSKVQEELRRMIIKS